MGTTTKEPTSRLTQIHGFTVTEVNAYALYCGYVQVVETPDEMQRVTLLESFGCYEVIHTNRNILTEDWLNCQSFRKLSDARKHFRNVLKGMRKN
jgi:hypothetical protein